MRMGSQCEHLALEQLDLLYRIARLHEHDGRKLQQVQTRLHEFGVADQHLDTTVELLGDPVLTASGIDAFVTFGGKITAARTVTLDAAETAGTINFDNAASYTIAGMQILTLDVSAGSADLR